MNWQKLVGLFLVCVGVAFWLIHAARAKEPTTGGGCFMTLCLGLSVLGVYLIIS